MNVHEMLPPGGCEAESFGRLVIRALKKYAWSHKIHGEGCHVPHRVEAVVDKIAGENTAIVTVSMGHVYRLTVEIEEIIDGTGTEGELDGVTEGDGQTQSAGDGVSPR